MNEYSLAKVQYNIPQIRNYAHDMIQKRKVGMRFLTSISHRYHEVRVSSMYLNMCLIMHLS